MSIDVLDKDEKWPVFGMGRWIWPSFSRKWTFRRCALVDATRCSFCLGFDSEGNSDDKKRVNDQPSFLLDSIPNVRIASVVGGAPDVGTCFRASQLWGRTENVEPCLLWPSTEKGDVVRLGKFVDAKNGDGTRFKTVDEFARKWVGYSCMHSSVEEEGRTGPLLAGGSIEKHELEASSIDGAGETGSLQLLSDGRLATPGRRESGRHGSLYCSVLIMEIFGWPPRGGRQR
ncbi:hypothetical protein MKZ38_001641 [Zalerion maritima]|uniref:Uncharacterized protein n=1 Tax=Zalerion maritima TaxID=339359 RepID=A0AAD5RRL4_9PEZI|nr:hypothetical protein MKZ38_001641 [Zalerion maritima]